MPVLFIVFFKIKIAIIKKKSNLSYLNTNQKPFAYCQKKPALVSAYPIPHKESFDAHNFCYQISSGTCRYMYVHDKGARRYSWKKLFQCSVRL